MHATERQRRIVEISRVDGRVEVTALAEQLAVTPETVRRDLSLLERRNLLRRVHGGAIAIEYLGFEPRLAERQVRLTEEKERIAKVALEQLPSEGTVLLDAGSTTELIASHLPFDRELRIVTNSVAIAAIVANHENLSLFLVGGRVRGKTMAAVGAWATNALRDIGVDVAFLGTNGISARRGLTTPDQDEAIVKQAMVAASHRTVLVCDHTKFGAEHFATFANLDAIDTIITDSGLDDETAADIEGLGPDLVRA